MRTFTIITEADARVLERGSTVALAPGGHVTPLAQDTLRERRIEVVSATADTDTAVLRASRGRAPRGHRRRSHVGRAEERLCGTYCGLAGSRSPTSGLKARIPSITRISPPRSARLVARREADAGIVLDGAGLGSAIAANKIRGIRAAMCVSKTLARYAREHNGANVLTLGSTLVARGGGPRYRGHVPGHADDRAPLPAAARQDSSPGTDAIGEGRTRQVTDYRRWSS